jgi:homoaconitase/3-isopropylmalate dehydratase large subunit
VTPGQYQLAADLHLLNEVSSPQAFDALRERSLRVRHPSRTFGSSDHSVSTGGDPSDFMEIARQDHRKPPEYSFDVCATKG